MEVLGRYREIGIVGSCGGVVQATHHGGGPCWGDGVRTRAATLCRTLSGRLSGWLKRPAGWRDPKNRPGGVNGNGGLSLARRETACYRQSVFHGPRSEVTNEACARLGSGGCRSARPSATGSSRKREAPILAARSDLANASRETGHDELSVPGSPAVPLVAEEPAPSAHWAKEEIATAQNPRTRR
jgi:hypothetical protein